MSENVTPGPTPVPLTRKVIGSTTAGASVAVLIAWGWNMAVPGAPMSAEVAVALGVMTGPVVKYLVSWLPTPGE